MIEANPAPIYAVAWSPDGRLLAGAGSDTTIRLWDRDSGGLRNIFLGHADSVGALAFTPDGKTLLSGSSDQTIRVWEIVSGQPLRILQGYAVSHFAVAW